MVPWVSVGYSRKVIRASPWHAEPTYAWVAVGTTRVSAPPWATSTGSPGGGGPGVFSASSVDHGGVVLGSLRT
jgi:hypothetical protein